MVVPDDKPEVLEEYKWAFEVGYSWRDHHIFPMRRVHHELVGNVRSKGKNGFSYSRVKRMASIRAKLALGTIKLNQIQDFGGCRAVMDAMSDYHALIARYENGGTVHTIRQSKDYTKEPRTTGYRGYHAVLEYKSSGDDSVYSGHRVEIQIRTGLQHAWATAVEAVGIMIDESLKSGVGNHDWLRLFALMASEFAEEEHSPIVPNTPSNLKVRRDEIKKLNEKLNASLFLEKMNNAMDYIGQSEDNYNFYLIQIDKEQKKLRVDGVNNPIMAASHYDSVEKNRGKIISVLVSIDRIEDLQRAFPNYFMDVSIFCNHLRTIINPLDTNKLAEKTSRMALGTEKKSSNYLDLSWLSGFSKSVK